MAWLLNWVWQGLAIAVVAAAGLRALGPKASARVRYHVWGGTFVAIAFLPLVELGVAMAPRPMDLAPAPFTRDALLRVPVPQLPTWCSTAAWAGLVAFSVTHAVRLLIALRWLSLAKRRATPLPCDLVETLLPLVRTATRRRAALVESPSVRVAAVLGLARPLIALAPRALGSLTRGELACIVAHERAHLDRWDDVVGGAQRLVMAVVGWHPALRWADRRLQAERERACDDRAVAATGSARAYAACLVRVAELVSAREPLMALGVSSSRSEVIQRVERLVPDPRRAPAGSVRSPRRWDRAAAMAMSLAVALLGLTLRQPFESTAPITDTASRDAHDARSPFASVDGVAEPSEHTGLVAAARDGLVPARPPRTQVTTPALTTQARPGARRRAPPLQPAQSRQTLPSSPLVGEAPAEDEDSHDAGGLAALILAAAPVSAREARLALVTGMDSAVHPLGDAARPQGAAWWVPAARVGRHSASAAKSTATAVADAGRAVGRAFVGGARANAAAHERRASLETSGVHSVQR